MGESKSEARVEEIIEAAAKLYSFKGFKDITLKDISEATDYTRTSIYYYFHTKEEIFLALLEREYKGWIEDLEQLTASEGALTRAKFATRFANTLAKHDRLLKILSMNHYDLEEGCRDSHLVTFKGVYGKVLKSVDQCIKHFFPKMTTIERDRFIYVFFPFMFGVYPYCVVSDRQREAMRKARVNFRYMTVNELIEAAILQLLPDTAEN